MKIRPLHMTFSLKWHPFQSDLPNEAIRADRGLERFADQLSDMVQEGGFALIQGENGTGKSMALRYIAESLGQDRDNEVATLVRPQSSVSDFYRELGELFNIDIRSSNRWASFRHLRERWRSKMESTRRRPVLLIDEAQMMQIAVLRELQTLVSDRLDARKLLTVVLCGDSQLISLFEEPEVHPIVSRIRHRLDLRPLDSDTMAHEVTKLLEAAGNPQLISPVVIRKLADQSLGNWRALTHMANELMLHGRQHELTTLDEKAWLELHGAPHVQAVTKRRGSTSRG